jgi:hypothetical protein
LQHFHFSWNRFVAIQIWIFVLFLIYTIGAELNSLFGDGELLKILFKRRSSGLKLSRRQGIRTLVRLSRLTETHALDELRDPNTEAHLELIGLISGLAMRKALQALKRVSVFGFSTQAVAIPIRAEV